LPAILIGSAFVVSLLTVALVVWVQSARLASAPPPTVAVQLGDNWQTLRDHSTYAFTDYQSHPDGYFIELQPLTLTYSNPAHRVDLPGTQAVNVFFKQGHISQLIISPYGEQQEWSAIAAGVQRLTASLETAGWSREHPTQDNAALLTRARAYYDNPTFKHMM